MKKKADIKLTQKAKRAIIEKLLKGSCHLSDRQLAEQVPCDHKTVGTVRRTMVQRGEIPAIRKTVDTLGRKQPYKISVPTNKPKKYSIIYGDPAWKYSKGLKGSPGNHYPMMSTEDIKNLPISEIADDNCALLLWVTFPHLQSGLDVMKAWGFRYVGEAFTWIKTNKINGTSCFGTGNYTRHNAEFCLLGIKGSIQRVSKSISSVIISPRGKHSEKPAEIRDRIVELFGDLPRVELFARQNVDGWDAWGNECRDSINLTHQEVRLDISKFINTVQNDDCLKILRQMPDNSVDLVVTSPPYDKLRKYNGYSFDFNAIAKELTRVLKDGGVIVWNVNDATVKGSKSLTSYKQSIFFVEDCGLRLHDHMIYEKYSPTYPSGKKSVRYSSVFEHVYVFSKGKPKTVNLIADKVNKWGGYKRPGNSSYRNSDGSLRRCPKKVVSKHGVRGNIWKYKTGNNQSSKDRNAYKHPAIMPELLAHDHIRSWSNEGDVILDPFAGSGTVCAMAKVNGRSYIGIEISPEYCKLIKNRLDFKYSINELNNRSTKEYNAHIYSHDTKHKLWGWYMDEDYFPEKMTYKLFKEFFNIRFSTVVVDMGKYDIERDDLEPY